VLENIILQKRRSPLDSVDFGIQSSRDETGVVKDLLVVPCRIATIPNCSVDEKVSK
jgi:hypothetical protein